MRRKTGRRQLTRRDGVGRVEKWRVLRGETRRDERTNSGETGNGG
jgi:hypothetical protein